MAIRLEIKAQPGLTWAKQVEVCLDGIQHRMLRSLITLMVIALAVAFLTNVCVEWAVTTKLRRGVGEVRERDSRLDHFIAAVSKPVTPRELERLIGALPEGTASAQEIALRGWIDAKDHSLWPSLEVFAQRSRELEYWYDHQSVGYKRLLAGSGGLRAALADAAGREKIAGQTARNVHLHKPAWLDGYLADYAANETRLVSAAQAVNDGVARLNRPMLPSLESDQIRPPQNPAPEGETSKAPEQIAPTLVKLLARTKSDPSSQMAVVSLLNDFGMTLAVESVGELSEQARLRARVEVLLLLMRDEGTRSAWRKQFGASLSEFDMLTALAADKTRAQWLASQPHIKNGPIDGEEVATLARLLIRRREADSLWERLGGDHAENGAGSSAVVWLLVVSMTVCIVGVTNAMLVSVLERFREIATMKCLGALDTFIATLFLMEAGLLGIVGGLLGAALGGVVGVTRMAGAFGSWTWQYFPGAELAMIGAAALVAGWMLTTLAAIYPAIKAASMPPMEAMRVE